MNKDYYKTLGVSKSASKDEIKKAFYKLAHEYHPDKAGGNEAKFKEASEAYNTLSDDKKRSQYDNFGSGFQGNAGGQYQGGFGGFDASQGFDFSGFQNGQGFEFDLGDIFGDFFGGGGGGRGRAKAKKGRDISVDLNLTFAESIFGVKKSIFLTKTSKCSECGGSGSRKGTEQVTCPTCNGRGKIKEVRKSFFGTFATERVCDECLGAGNVPKEKCPKCHGAGILQKEDEIEVNIPADVNTGESIRLTGAGESVKGGSSGDLYIKLHIEKSNLFVKEGKNLITELNIKMTDAVLGGNYKMATLDGEIELKIPEGTSPEDVLRIRGKGVPYGNSQRGDILVKIKIKTPSRLSGKAKKIFEDLKKEGL